MSTPPLDQSGPLVWAVGSAAERRAGGDRRSEQRRAAYTSVPEERRAGRERRYWEERRGGYRRRRSREAPLSGIAGTAGALGSLAREQVRARRLLDEFARLSGPTEQRVTKLVRRQWPAYPLGARAFLAERLTALLKSVREGTSPDDEVRRQVEETVADWAAGL
ncbi:MAG TPA: hypothetical protein VF970_00990 [Gemmatimonadales bacterium]